MPSHASLSKSVAQTLGEPVILGPGEVRESLDGILRALEVAGGEDFLVSILMVDHRTQTVTCLSAPSLPSAYCNAIEGLVIGPNAGSCGTAAFFGRPIFVSDIATDPRWIGYRDVALEHGLHACWSTPVKDWNGEVLGTFAVYHREPRAPTNEEVKAIDLASAALTPLLARVA